MTAAPAWLADDPYPDGPHWSECERVHPGCAYRLGVQHGRAARLAMDAVEGHDPITEAALHGALADEYAAYISQP